MVAGGQSSQRNSSNLNVDCNLIEYSIDIENKKHFSHEIFCVQLLLLK